MHTDAAQALGKRRVDVEDLGVDFLTIVGHKVCAHELPYLRIDLIATQSGGLGTARCPRPNMSLLSSSEHQVPVRDQVLRCCDSNSGRVLFLRAFGAYVL